MLDVMIDIETMSTRPSAAVAAIGAVSFLVGPEPFVVRHRFYKILHMKDQGDRHFDPDTIRWWLQQEESARKELLAPGFSVLDALRDYSIWYEEVKPRYAWSLGANFDHVIMQNLYDTRGLRNPTIYRKQMCMRTLIKLFPGVQAPQVDGVAHNALHDAFSQAQWTREVFDHIRALEAVTHFSGEEQTLIPDEPAGTGFCTTCNQMRPVYRAGSGGSVPVGSICCSFCQLKLR
jgi:hypothetical protein